MGNEVILTTSCRITEGQQALVELQGVSLKIPVWTHADANSARERAEQIEPIAATIAPYINETGPPLIKPVAIVLKVIFRQS
jgi:hypothetical protein